MATRGKLRIYLGAAPGVGKTYAMLNEGWRAKQRGHDVVVGFVETYGRPNTAAQLRDLEVIPRRKVVYRGSEFEEMDVDAILARRPERVLVDELAHTNVPGARNEKRWQDVQELLEAGIDVITTLNVQHLESLNDVVERITGILQRETLPDAVARSADQVELVDMSPEALRRRMAHGNVYPPEKVDAALGNYFRPGNLAALRELALLWVADRVEENLQRYMADHAIAGPWETRERVLVAVKGLAEDELLVRRGARMAARAKGDLLCVHVRSGEGLQVSPPAQVERDRQLAREFGGTFYEVVGTDVARALTDFARAEQATQLVVGASQKTPMGQRLRAPVVNKIVRLSGPIDVHVISVEVGASEAETRLPRRRRAVVLPGPRLVAGWALAAVGLPVLTVVLTNLRVGLPGVLLLFLAAVVAVAAVGGTWPALAAAFGASILANYYFTRPFHTFVIAEPQNVLALVVFVGVAVVVSTLVSTAARRENEATRARAEAEVLARTAATLVGGHDPVAELLAYFRSTFALDAVAILHREDDRWHVDAAAGEPIPARPEAADLSVRLSEASRLVITGRALSADDRRVLSAFVAQLSSALQSRALRTEASAAGELAAVNELRAALLAAVSHDLRTPLSSIKASATSLLQGDVEWSPETTKEFLETIVSEADRLNTLVGNLLDMSRLQTGGLHLALREVGLEEIVAAALASLRDRARVVSVDVPETLPRIVADPALAERAIANLVDNAIEHAGDGPVAVRAGSVMDRVDLRIVDRGPGIPELEREGAFQPFRRLGDNDGRTGVGLGLAVARGFIEAMGGELSFEDTPGGGLTVVVGLKAAGR